MQNIAFLATVFILCAAARFNNFWASRASRSIVLATSTTLSVAEVTFPDNHHWPFLSGSKRMLHLSPRSRTSTTCNCIWKSIKLMKPKMGKHPSTMHRTCTSLHQVGWPECVCNLNKAIYHHLSHSSISKASLFFLFLFLCYVERKFTAVLLQYARRSYHIEQEEAGVSYLSF